MAAMDPRTSTHSPNASSNSHSNYNTNLPNRNQMQILTPTPTPTPTSNNISSSIENPLEIELESQTPESRPSIVVRVSAFHDNYKLGFKIAGALFALTFFTLELWARIDDLKNE